VKLLYSTTSVLNVFLTDKYFCGSFKLWFADEFNASANPPSSNPFRLFQDYQEIFRKDDRLNPKLVAHRNALKLKAENRIKDESTLAEVLETIDGMGTHGMRPVLAILEADTYIAHGKPILPVPPAGCASLTSIEYQLGDIHGPGHAAAELHLHHLYET
jgi:hypothetical protein